MPWRLIYCLFNRHRPDLGEVLWNGTRHLTQCRDCKLPLRWSNRGYWKPVDASDESGG
jgi:hypothetical protein